MAAPQTPGGAESERQQLGSASQYCVPVTAGWSL